jgi:hypothetical protein
MLSVVILISIANRRIIFLMIAFPSTFFLLEHVIAYCAVCIQELLKIQRISPEYCTGYFAWFIFEEFRKISCIVAHEILNNTNKNKFVEFQRSKTLQEEPCTPPIVWGTYSCMYGGRGVCLYQQRSFAVCKRSFGYKKLFS